MAHATVLTVCRPRDSLVAGVPVSHLPLMTFAPVLLVEDNDDVREALRKMLELRGHGVVEARDGEEAWKYLDTGGRAAVIVLDVNLPRMDGRVFREKLLAHEEHARIPVRRREGRRTNGRG
jgi:DNA-binding NtrC family response regulator